MLKNFIKERMRRGRSHERETKRIINRQPKRPERVKQKKGQTNKEVQQKVQIKGRKNKNQRKPTKGV